MRSTHRTNIGCTIHATSTVKLETDISMDEAQSKLEALGNEIIERDDEARTFKVLDTVTHPTEEVWVCDHCGAYSKSEEVTRQHEENCNGS